MHQYNQRINPSTPGNVNTIWSMGAFDKEKQRAAFLGVMHNTHATDGRSPVAPFWQEKTLLRYIYSP